MEEWKNGKINYIFQHSNIPTFQHSNIPTFLHSFIPSFQLSIFPITSSSVVSLIINMRF